MAARRKRESARDWAAQAEKLAITTTSREMEILRLLREGKSQPEIGRLLGLTRSGVWHRVQSMRARVESKTAQHDVEEAS